jgi:hypothetical protein
MDAILLSAMNYLPMKWTVSDCFGKKVHATLNTIKTSYWHSMNQEIYIVICNILPIEGTEFN